MRREYEPHQSGTAAQPGALKGAGSQPMAHLDQRGFGIPLDLRRAGDLLFSGRGGDGHWRGRGNGKGGPGRPGDLSGRHVLYVEDQQGREEALSVWVSLW